MAHTLILGITILFGSQVLLEFYTFHSSHSNFGFQIYNGSHTLIGIQKSYGSHAFHGFHTVIRFTACLWVSCSRWFAYFLWILHQ